MLGPGTRAHPVKVQVLDKLRRMKEAAGEGVAGRTSLYSALSLRLAPSVHQAPSAILLPQVVTLTL